MTSRRRPVGECLPCSKREGQTNDHDLKHLVPEKLPKISRLSYDRYPNLVNGERQPLLVKVFVTLAAFNDGQHALPRELLAFMLNADANSMACLVWVGIRDVAKLQSYCPLNVQHYDNRSSAFYKKASGLARQCYSTTTDQIRPS